MDIHIQNCLETWWQSFILCCFSASFRNDFLSNSRQHTKGKAVAAETSEEFQVEKEMCWEEVPIYLYLFYTDVTSVP